MPYDTESLAELNRRLQSELPLSGSGEVLRRNLYTPFSRALAGAVHGLHGHIEWRVKQMFPQTCDDDVLETLHAPLWLGSGRLPAVPASGKATIKGNREAVIPKGTLLNRRDGTVFVVKTGVTIPSSGTVAVELIAETAGVNGNTAPGEKLTIANTISGVESEVITSGIAGGSDMESIASLRERIIDSRKNGRDVGRTSDWERWTREVPGVTRVWPAPKLSGIGTVTVYIMRDNDTRPYPQGAELQAVQKHLEHSGLPFGEIHVVAPTPRNVDFRIKIIPDTPEVRQAVQTALANLLQESAAPVAYDRHGDLALPAKGHTIPRSHITQAISNAVGEYDHQLIAPAADITFEVGQLATMGNIQWIT